MVKARSQINMEIQSGVEAIINCTYFDSDNFVENSNFEELFKMNDSHRYVDDCTYVVHYYICCMGYHRLCHSVSLSRDIMTRGTVVLVTSYDVRVVDRDTVAEGGEISLQIIT